MLIGTLALLGVSPTAHGSGATHLNVSGPLLLPANASAPIEVTATIDGADEGDSIAVRAIALTVSPSGDRVGGPVALAPAQVVRAGGTLTATTRFTPAPGLYEVFASYRHVNQATPFARRHSLLEVGPDFAEAAGDVYDDLALPAGVVQSTSLTRLAELVRAPQGRSAAPRRSAPQGRSAAPRRGAPQGRSAAPGRGAAPARTHTTPLYEFAPPQGRFRGRRSRGLVVVVHGGAWFGGCNAYRTRCSEIEGRMWLATTALAVRRFGNRGYSTLNVDYHSGHLSQGDVLRFVRTSVRGRQPVCIYGESAGANLAMLVGGAQGVASRVRCVVAAAGPSDLLAYPASPLLAHAGLCDGADALIYARCVAQAWFGPSSLNAWSPVRRRPARRILTAEAATDAIIPRAQGAALRRRFGGRVRHLHLRRPPPGATDLRIFVHGPVTRAELDRYFSVERAFVDAAMRGR